MKRVLVMVLLIAFASTAQAFDQTHAAFDAVVKSTVKDGKVGYAALRANPAALDAYIASLGAIPTAEFDKWTDNQKKAAYINAYNAFTIKSIVEAYPVSSIKKIDGVWKKRAWKLAGRSLTLDTIEHEKLRPMGDPRVHSAINCASAGCPPLQPFAFRAEKLDEQLDVSAAAWVNEPGHNRVDTATKTARVSKIFDWFGGDFVPRYFQKGRFPELSEKDAATVGFLYTYGNAEMKKAIDAGIERVKYVDYDWSLNDR